jgi:hypothetical protein
VLLVAGGVSLLLVASGPLLKLLATNSVAQACVPMLPRVVASSGILALTVSGSYAMLALGQVRALAIINVVAVLAMLIVSLRLLSPDGVWAVIDGRLAFGVVVFLIYIPLLRNLGILRFNSNAGSMDGQLAGGEGA